MVKRFALLVLLSTFMQAVNAQWHKRELIATETELFDQSYFIPRDIHFSGKNNGFIIAGDLILKYNGIQWQPLAQLGGGTNLRGLYSLNETNTFFVGDRGTVYKYSGKTLKKIDVHNDNHFSGIHVVDSNNIWISGSGGTILHLIGDSIVTYLIDVPFDLQNIYMDKPNHGWAVCTRSFWNQGIQSYYGTIYEFKNNQWTEHPFSVDGIISDIGFTPSGEGYMSSSENLYHLSKVRNSWEAVFPQTLNQPIRSISFLNDTLGIAMQAEDSYLLYNKGKWTARQAALPGMVGVAYADPSSIWAVSARISGNDYGDWKNHLIYQLKDTGWQKISLKYLDTIRTEPWKRDFFNVTAFGKKHLRINGFLLNIPDNADWIDTLKRMDPPLDSFISAKQYNETIAWATDEMNLVSANENKFTVHQVFDTDPDFSQLIFDVHFFEDTTAWVVGLKYPADVDAEDVPFLAYYDHAKGKVTKEYKPSTTSLPYQVHFANKTTGWCVGESGLILQYVNSNWKMMNSPTDEFLLTIFTIDADNAWAGGENGALLKYDGAAWEKVNINTTKNINAIYFTDRNHGWLVGDEGLMYKYDGTNWKQDTIITTEDLYDIFMVNPNYGWAVGGEGTILQFIESDTTTIGRMETAGIPSTIFPNPSSGNTTIQFELKKAANTVINLFNQQGNKLATYNLGMLDAGKSSKTISISGLQEGTYFYEIISDGKRGKGRFIKVF